MRVSGKKHAALYKSLVDELQEKLEFSEGTERKGLALASLMKFKQICNHRTSIWVKLVEENESGKSKTREIAKLFMKKSGLSIYTQLGDCRPLAAYLNSVST